ncbi:hypothetical protein FRB96_002777 [Tulasnella sp. 330]|nr:hypothetical protein FRB96_002777 [Tulasnella sp. 330]KAG8876930.1 hypothetical protein FRB97_003818 [Tulasnella sp. 331]KAG8884605.1 hypothetical protein FRB98_002319 [Tulasnella sp. 332]
MATTTSSLRLNLSSIKIPDIPTAQEALVAAREIIADTEGNGENFVPGPVYHINPGRKYQELGVGIQVVETLSRSVSPPDPKWFMRVSRHGPADGLFDEFWDGLGLDHLAKEAK